MGASIVLAVTGVALALAADAAPGRIALGHGQTSATRRGVVEGDDTAAFVLGARAGQTLEVHLRSDDPFLYFDVAQPASGDTLWTGSGQADPDRYRGTLARDGDYRLDVHLVRAEARHGGKAPYSLDVSLTGPVVTPPSEPPLVDAGVCPFECCSYQEWKATKPARIRSDRRRDAPVVAELAAGDWVLAVTGAVVTSKPGRARVLRPTELDGEPSHQAAEGDELVVLHREGEGYSKVWLDGRAYSAEVEMPPPPGEPPVFEVLAKPEAEWWVYVRTDAGRAGWTDDTDAFTHNDACGHDPPLADEAAAFRRRAGLP